MDSTAHVKMHKHKRVVQRSTTSNDALVVEVDEQPPTNLKSDQEDAIDLVLSCPDLLVRIIVYVADGTDHQSLSKLSGVSKSFKKITKSDQFWRELCYHRWRGKWGFHKRWEKALAEYEDRNVDKRPAWQRRAQESMDMYDIECGQEKRSKMYESKSRDDYFWECRYSKEELDGIRKYMRDDELESFVFDFRYWSVQEAVWDDNRPFKLASGLYQSASEDVRFVNTHESIPGFDVGPLEIRGKVVGYPKYGHGDNELEVEYMIGWRSDPDCFHRSRVKRLDDWGWQIYNSLQVLRAIDALPQQCNANNKRCTNCRGSCCVRKCLWKDFLDSLVYADSPVESELRGIPIIAEVPTQVVEFIQTCDAGWWSDFVRMLHA